MFFLLLPWHSFFLPIIFPFRKISRCPGTELWVAQRFFWVSLARFALIFWCEKFIFWRYFFVFWCDFSFSGVIFHFLALLFSFSHAKLFIFWCSFCACHFANPKMINFLVFFRHQHVEINVSTLTGRGRHLRYRSVFFNP